MQKKARGDHASSFLFFTKSYGANEKNKSCGKNDRKGLTVKVNLKKRSSTLMKETLKEQGMRKKTFSHKEKSLFRKKKKTY